MLDALVAEARLRWGLDPATGLQVVAAEALIGHPDRAVPAAPDRAAGDPARDARRGGRRPLPGPGRARRRRPARRSCGGSTRPTIRSGGSGSADGMTVGSLDAAIARRPALPRAGRARAGRWPGRGRCPGSRPACASPTAARGTASRPTPRCASTSSRRPTRSTTRSRRGPRRSSPASSATCGCRSSCTPSWRPRRASST